MLMIYTPLGEGDGTKGPTYTAQYIMIFEHSHTHGTYLILYTIHLIRNVDNLLLSQHQRQYCLTCLNVVAQNIVVHKFISTGLILTMGGLPPLCQWTKQCWPDIGFPPLAQQCGHHQPNVGVTALSYLFNLSYLFQPLMSLLLLVSFPII